MPPPKRNRAEEGFGVAPGKQGMHLPTTPSLLQRKHHSKKNHYLRECLNLIFLQADHKGTNSHLHRKAQYNATIPLSTETPSSVLGQNRKIILKFQFPKKFQVNNDDNLNSVH